VWIQFARGDKDQLKSFLHYDDTVLVKWITCEVMDRREFDRGQRAWAAPRDAPGLLGQGGGWSLRTPGTAHIFASWADRASYQAFMDGQHDAIAGSQAGTYASIRVRLLEHLLDIARPAGAGFPDASLLRLAHCHVRPARAAHFVSAQEAVWNPGMATAPGMLGGLFAQATDTEFLVLSMWRSAADHQRYQAKDFPRLRRQAAAAEDLAEITGDLVQIEQEWSVRPGDAVHTSPQ
jgi:heme-degrading monooxygenase HmoA